MPNRRVNQYDLNKQLIATYPSQKDAVKQTGISDTYIRSSIQQNTSTHGYYFSFPDPIPQQFTDEVCEYCGVTFKCQKFRLEKHKHIFCSRQCNALYRIEHSELNCTCEYCGKKFHRKQSQIDKCERSYCSQECYTNAQKILKRGENNHQYGLKGKQNSSWESDEKISHYGYRMIRCLDHPFKNCDDFVFEHRLVAEKYLLTNENSVTINGKRYLSPDFHVHHIDFDKLNNSVDNLYILPKEVHMAFHNSLNTIIHDETNGRIKAIQKNTYTEDELRKKFFLFIQEHGFGSTGTK